MSSLPTWASRSARALVARSQAQTHLPLPPPRDSFISANGLLSSVTGQQRPFTHLVPAMLVGDVLLQALLAAEQLGALLAFKQLVA